MPRKTSTADLKERLLSVRDYGHLLEVLAETCEHAVGSPSHCQSLVLVHPDADGVCMRIFRRGGQIHRGRPYQRAQVSTDDIPLKTVLWRSDFNAMIAPYELGECEPDLQALLALPIHSEDGWHGVFLASFHSEIPDLSEKSKKLLNEHCSMTGKMLGACHEFEKFRRQRNEMQEVFEAATMLSGGQVASDIAHGAVEIMIERLSFDRAAALTVQADGQDLTILSSAGFESDEVADILLPHDHGSLPARSFRELTPLWETHTGHEPFADPLTNGAANWNVVCLPLINSEGRAIGVLYGDHKSNQAQMSIERLISLQLFANSLGSRLETAHLLNQVAELAEQDGLTGLANRRAFDEQLAREVARARRQQLPISILMIDVNRFKDLNDTYGHMVGDDVLIETAKLLRDCVRETDVVARYGGDEFVILMPDTDTDSGVLVRQRILEAVEKVAVRLNREHWRFRLSLGLRCAITDATEALVDQADKALYAHKMTQVRRQLLQKIVASDEDQLYHWDHYLGKLLRIMIEKDPGSFDHARRVMNLCIAICNQLELDSEYTECVALAAMLHDVGKISIPGAILNRPGALTPDEYRVVQAHTKIGYDLLREVNYLGEVCEFVRAYYERYDGKLHSVSHPAFPGKQKGEQIPLGARILKVADSFDAMVSNRPYKGPKSNGQALAELRAEAGHSYDPRIVAIFAEWMDSVLNSSLDFAAYDFE